MESPTPQTYDLSAQRLPAAETGHGLIPAIHAYGKRSLIWIAVLAATVAGTLFLSTSLHIYPSSLAHALLEGYGVITGVCIVYCLWVQYSVTRERKFLLSTIVFSGLSLAALTHAIMSLLSAPGSQLHLIGTRYTHGWHVMAGILLIMAAGNNTVSNAQTYRKTGGRTLAAWLLLSVCAMLVPIVFDPQWLRLHSILPQPIALQLRYVLSELVEPRSLDIISIGTATLALIAHIRSYAEHEDEYSKRLMPFLTLALAANTGAFASHAEYDAVWWASHGLLVCGLMVLLIELGVQFGASYSVSQARVRHMEAVHYMSSRLTNTLDLRVVLLALVSDTAGMLSAKFASVMLSDDTGQTLTTEVTYGLPESPLRPRQPQNVEGQGRPAFFGGHTARSFRERRICMVDDVYTDVEFLPWKVLAHHEGYAVSVPLVYHDLALGVLNLFFEKHVPVNDEKIKLFQTLASSAAVAIVNAQLYDRTLSQESNEGDAPFSLRLAS